MRVYFLTPTNVSNFPYFEDYTIFVFVITFIIEESIDFDNISVMNNSRVTIRRSL